MKERHQIAKKMRCLKTPKFLFCEPFRQDVAGCFSHKQKFTVKTTRLESHSSLVDSLGWAAVIRACASATRWRRALVAWHFFGVTWRMIGAFSLQAFCEMMLLEEIFSYIVLVECKSVDGG